MAEDPGGAATDWRPAASLGLSFVGLLLVLLLFARILVIGVSVLLVLFSIPVPDPQHALRVDLPAIWWLAGLSAAVFALKCLVLRHPGAGR